MERRRKHTRNQPPQDAGRFLTIAVYNQQRDLPIHKASARRLVHFILKKEKNTLQKISLYFVSSKKITELHQDFFNDPTPTDCITFPIDPLKEGEIFVCPKTALSYDPEHPYLETTLYVIHTLLHLMGYDDIDKRKRASMVRKQNRLLKLAEKHGCLLETSS